MQNINVNIVPDNFPQTIRYSQGDIGRQFKINVADFDIPVGATVKIQATKPSGFGFSVAGVVSDNSVTFTTTTEMTDEAGRFQAELQITAGGDVIGTANFLMIGERNPHPEGTTDGSQGTIIPELTLLVERVEKAASDILDMEVVATTLPAGSQATYSYDEDLNKATFGIPEGQAGAGAAGVVASAYSAAKAYKVGDYVLYNSNLYRCTTAITTAEAWTAAHWTQVVLADDVTDLKTDFSYIIGEADPLDNIAYGSVTFRELFETNNKIPDGDFESGMPSGSRVNAGNPIITNAESVSKIHSLKCYGNSSTQIGFYANIILEPLVDYGVWYIACKVKVDRYASGGGAGYVTNVSFNGSTVQQLVTNTNGKWLTLSQTAGGALKDVAYDFVFGTAGSADCDAYIDDIVLINLHEVFGSNDVGVRPSKADMDRLYEQYIQIKNLNYLNSEVVKLEKAQEKADDEKLLVGVVLEATGADDRFLAMNQLLNIGNKRLKNPNVAITSDDYNKASKGVVCALPNCSPAMLQNYNFDILYSKNADVQAIPASTTKVMSLVTGLDYITNIKEKITIISADIESGSGNYFNNGDIVTIEDLMFGMMLPSSNTCANAFARVCGEKMIKLNNAEATPTASECKAKFIENMNAKALAIGMSDSSFTSPSGNNATCESTAIDLLKMMVEACSYNDILKIWNKKTYTIKVEGTNARNVAITSTVTNATLEQNFYIIGGKTGYWDVPESYDLVMVAQKI